MPNVQGRDDDELASVILSSCHLVIADAGVDEGLLLLLLLL
jgi:hypothetical protein